MIVIDKAKLKFLLAGRSVSVDVRREYRKGRSYALGLSHNRSVCRVRVIDVAELEDGFRLTVARVSEEHPRLLARNPGAQRRDYVEKLADAVRDEPEALSDEQLRELAGLRPMLARSGQEESLLTLRDRLLADLDEALRTTISRRDRDKIRAAKHHLGKLGRPS